MDKKSFIRWKQRDIHEKRAQRKQDIQNLTLSNQVNQVLQKQIDGIITKLMMGGTSLDEGNIANAFKLEDSSLGEAPTGDKGPTYSQMLQSLFEEIQKRVKDESDKKEAYIRELGVHRKKIGDEIAKNAAELSKLEKEEKSKITMEGLHEGFDSSVWLRKGNINDSMLLSPRLRSLLSLVARRNRNRKYKLWRFSTRIR